MSFSLPTCLLKCKAASKGSRFHVRWVERDPEGGPLLKRSRSGETRKHSSSNDGPSSRRSLSSKIIYVKHLNSQVCVNRIQLSVT